MVERFGMSIFRTMHTGLAAALLRKELMQKQISLKTMSYAGMVLLALNATLELWLNNLVDSKRLEHDLHLIMIAFDELVPLVNDKKLTAQWDYYRFKVKAYVGDIPN